MASDETVADTSGVPRRHQLTKKWSIDVDDSFIRRVVNEDLQLLSQGPPVRTIWLSIWSPPKETPPSGILDGIKKSVVHPSPEQRFEEHGTDPEELRYASWYPETVGGREQWSLYGYTVRHGSYVQAAFISDEADDLDWVLTTWRSLRYTEYP